MAKIGVDFGTTNSMMVSFDKNSNSFEYHYYYGGKPATTSSTVWYYDNSINVGNESREKMYQYAGVDGHHFEKSIKLKLGNTESINIFGEKIPPYKIAGAIINQLKKEAIKNKINKLDSDLNKAVFTIPINFSGKARHELRKSAHEAGIEITTFIHEPFAAVVAYYFNKFGNNHLTVKNELERFNNQHLLTFDWGGGTLDITVAHIQDGRIFEKGTAEMTNVAGDKFDEDIAKYVWNKFLNKYGKKYSEEYLEKVRKNKWGYLVSIAERCKIKLSTVESVDFLFERITQHEDIDEKITRADLENIIQRPLDEAMNKVEKALKEAGINYNDVSSVLLTGGTCNIPVVQKILIDKFGHRVEISSEPELLIAKGAAIIAEMEWMPILAKDILIQLSDDSYWPMFERNTPITSDKLSPKSETFVCVDSRSKNAKIIVKEGFDQSADTTLGVINVPLFGSGKFGDDIYVEGVINEDIILRISAYSKMVQGIRTPEDEYTRRKSCEINQLCFGLDFGR